MMDKRLLPAFALFFILSVWIALQSPAYALTLEPVPNELAEIVSSEALEEEPKQAENLMEPEKTEPFVEDSKDSEAENPVIFLDTQPIYEELHSIRQNSDVFLFFVIPVFCAFYIIIKFCYWFSDTFLESIL